MYLLGTARGELDLTHAMRVQGGASQVAAHAVLQNMEAMDRARSTAFERCDVAHSSSSSSSSSSMQVCLRHHLVRKR